MPIERQKEIRKRRQRRVRIGKLKAQLAQAKSEKEKERLIDLIQKRDPYFDPSKQ